MKLLLTLPMLLTLSSCILSSRERTLRACIAGTESRIHVTLNYHGTTRRGIELYQDTILFPLDIVNSSYHYFDGDDGFRVWGGPLGLLLSWLPLITVASNNAPEDPPFAILNQIFLDPETVIELPPEARESEDVLRTALIDELTRLTKERSVAVDPSRELRALDGMVRSVFITIDT